MAPNVRGIGTASPTPFQRPHEQAPEPLLQGVGIEQEDQEDEEYDTLDSLKFLHGMVRPKQRTVDLEDRMELMRIVARAQEDDPRAQGRITEASVRPGRQGDDRVWEGILWVKAKGGRFVLWVPRGKRKVVLRKSHGAEHESAKKMQRTIDNWFTWEEVSEDVEEYVRTCQQCRTLRELCPTSRNAGNLSPFQRVYLTAIESLPKSRKQGCNTLYVVADFYSGWLEVEARPGLHGATLTKFVEREVEARYRPPKEIFVSMNIVQCLPVMRERKQDWTISLLPEDTRPTTLGPVENLEDEVRREGREWPDELHHILKQARMTPLEEGLTPQQLLFGKKIRSRGERE